MEKYLITGFSGFVAYHFLHYLDSVMSESQKNVEILGIDIQEPIDFNTNDYCFSNISLSFRAINMLDYNSLEQIVCSFQPDYILHLASMSSVGDSWKRPIECFKNNTNIFLNLIESIRLNKVACRILSVGSSEEYGKIDLSSLPLNETTPLFPISPYAIARVSQEMLSKCYVESFNLDIILTRSFNHIGIKQKEQFVIPSFIKQIIEKMNNNKSIEINTGNLEIIRDFLDVRDVVRAYYLLLKKGTKGEIYNVCTGKGYSLEQVIEIISNILQVNVTINQENALIRPNDNPVIIGNNSKIKEHTDWSPIYSIEESLKEIIAYWKSVIKSRNVQ